MERKMKDRVTLICGKCLVEKKDKKLFSLRMFEEHTARHFEEHHKLQKLAFRYKCPDCEWKAMDLALFKEHFERHHGKRANAGHVVRLDSKYPWEWLIDFRSYINSNAVATSDRGEVLWPPEMADYDDASCSTPNQVHTPLYDGSRTPGRRTPGYETPGNRTPENRTPGYRTPGSRTPSYTDRNYSRSKTPEYSGNYNPNRSSRYSGTGSSTPRQTPLYDGFQTPVYENVPQSSYLNQEDHSKTKPPPILPRTSTDSYENDSIEDRKRRKRTISKVPVESLNRPKTDIPKTYQNERRSGVMYKHTENEYAGSKSPGYENDPNELHEIRAIKNSTVAESRSTSKVPPSQNRQAILTKEVQKQPPSRREVLKKNDERVQEIRKKTQQEFRNGGDIESALSFAPLPNTPPLGVPVPSVPQTLLPPPPVPPPSHNHYMPYQQGWNSNIRPSLQNPPPYQPHPNSHPSGPTPQFFNQQFNFNRTNANPQINSWLKPPPPIQQQPPVPPQLNHELPAFLNSYHSVRPQSRNTQDQLAFCQTPQHTRPHAAQMPRTEMSSNTPSHEEQDFNKTRQHNRPNEIRSNVTTPAQHNRSYQIEKHFGNNEVPAKKRRDSESDRNWSGRREHVDSVDMKPNQRELEEGGVRGRPGFCRMTNKIDNVKMQERQQPRVPRVKEKGMPPTIRRRSYSGSESD